MSIKKSIFLFIVIISILLNIVYINKYYQLDNINNIEENNIEEKISYDELSGDEKSIIFQNNLEKFTYNKDLNNIKILITEMQPKLDDFIIERISIIIMKYAYQFSFPPELIAILIYRESAFNTISISSAKCVGLMQINPAAHKDKIEKLELDYYNLFKIDNNIKLGCMILHEYYMMEKNIEKALRRYVGGDHPQYINDILYAFANVQIKKKMNSVDIFNEEDIIEDSEEILEENSEVLEDSSNN